LLPEKIEIKQSRFTKIPSP